MTSFPAARLHLHAVARQPVQLPDFAGSTLRGAFGQALKRQVCVTGMDDCRQCPLYRSCDYPAIFETPPPQDAARTYSRIPSAWVVEPPPIGAVTLQTGQTLDFSLVVMGPLLGKLPLILSAWRAALVRGIGKGSGRLDLYRAIDEQGAVVWDAASGSGPAPAGELAVPAPPQASAELVLRFATPFLLRRRGKDLRQDTVTAADLLLALVRRTDDLLQLQFGQNPGFNWAALASQAHAVQADFGLTWQGWQRYSSRQEHYRRVGGLSGTCRLKQTPAAFWPFLWLGQWLHVGRKATFGLGRYTLEGQPQ